MARLQSLCPACEKPASILNTEPFFESSVCDGLDLAQFGKLTVPAEWSSLRKLTCGHIFYQPHSIRNTSLTVSNNLIVKIQGNYKSLDGQAQTRHYQDEGLNFIVQSGFNCLVADQQGLGKTIEAILTLREYKEETLPAIVVVKSATIWQWQREIKKWFGILPSDVWMIRDGKGFIPPGFKIYLISMDTLKAYVKPTGREIKIKAAYGFATTTKSEFAVSPIFHALKFKLLIADEIHSFKNNESKRSQALVELVAQLGITKKVFLSGTPIMNRAEEYFIPLNLLDPLNFPSLEQFRTRYLMKENNKWSRINPYSLDAFKAVTAPIVIRRERNQVMKDLPPFSRVFEDAAIDNASLKKLYNAELDKMKAKQENSNSGELTFKDIQDNVMTMRRIIGMAKAELVLDFVHEFLDNTEDEKIVIGVHHKSVRDYLLTELSEYRPLSLSGEDSADRKQLLIEAFQRPERRLMIVNIIAGGTGLNLQFCNNCIVLERQWNSATEEQFEDRFNRFGQQLPVTAVYPVAIKTIDEWFHAMVEDKRMIFGETVAIDCNSWMTAGQVNEMIDWATRNRL